MRIFMERNNPMTALLSNWVDACCLLMAPLNDALYRYVMNTRLGTIHGTSVGELLAWIKEDENPRKGEMVLIKPRMTNCPPMRCVRWRCCRLSCR